MALALGPTLALLSGLALGPGAREGGSAEPEPAQISWEAPLECPGPRWLSHRLHAYLGRAPEAGVVVAGRVQAKRAGFVLELRTEVGGARERHRVEHHDCAALVEIAASLAAIAIDPLATGDEALAPSSEPHREPALPRLRAHRRAETVPAVEIQRPSSLQGVREPGAARLAPARATGDRARGELPESSPLPSPRAAPAPPPLESTLDPPLLELGPEPAERGDLAEPAEPAADKGRTTRLLLSALGGLGLRLFPNPAPQVRARVGVERGSARLAVRAELGAGAALAGRFRSAEGTSGGDLVAWDVAARPCVVPRWGRVELRTCAAFGAGQIRARGVGVAGALRRAHPWLWLAAELGVGVRVQRSATVSTTLVLDLGADFNVYRPSFSTSNPDASYITPPVGGHGRLGVELGFF